VQPTVGPGHTNGNLRVSLPLPLTQNKGRAVTGLTSTWLLGYQTSHELFLSWWSNIGVLNFLRPDFGACTTSELDPSRIPPGSHTLMPVKATLEFLCLDRQVVRYHDTDFCAYCKRWIHQLIDIIWGCINVDNKNWYMSSARDQRWSHDWSHDSFKSRNKICDKWNFRYLSD